MKLARTLLYIGGAANALFFLFHLWLGWRIHQWAQLPAGARPLMEMLNGGGALFVLFLAVASLAFNAEILVTGLGRLVLALGVTLYGLRALAEFVVTPSFTPAIFATCLVTSLLYLGALGFKPAKSPPPPS